MTRAPTEAQIRRAVKGTLDGGLPIGRVEVRPDGTICILPPDPGTAQPAASRQPESWDDADKPTRPFVRTPAVR